jgi:hypothetical protein
VEARSPDQHDHFTAPSHGIISTDAATRMRRTALSPLMPGPAAFGKRSDMSLPNEQPTNARSEARPGCLDQRTTWRSVFDGCHRCETLWTIASLGFTIYVANFNSYDTTYGSLDGVIILLTCYVSAFVMLLGAVINAQAEKQSRTDRRMDLPRRWRIMDSRRSIDWTERDRTHRSEGWERLAPMPRLHPTLGAGQEPFRTGRY